VEVRPWALLARVIANVAKPGWVRKEMKTGATAALAATGASGEVETAALGAKAAMAARMVQRSVGPLVEEVLLQVLQTVGEAGRSRVGQEQVYVAGGCLRKLLPKGLCRMHRMTW